MLVNVPEPSDLEVDVTRYGLELVAAVKAGMESQLAAAAAARDQAVAEVDKLDGIVAELERGIRKLGAMMLVAEKRHDFTGPAPRGIDMDDEAYVPAPRTAMADDVTQAPHRGTYR